MQEGSTGHWQPIGLGLARLAGSTLQLFGPGSAHGENGLRHTVDLNMGIKG